MMKAGSGASIVGGGVPSATTPTPTPNPLSPLPSRRCLSLLSNPHPQISNPSPALWTQAEESSVCSSPAKPLGPAAIPSGCAACPLSGDVDSGEFLDASRKMKKMDLGWVFWCGRDLGVKEAKMKAIPASIVGVLGFSPELVPVVYRLFTGVGSSFYVLSVIWAFRVGSGLVSLSQCFVAGSVEHHGRSLELGLSPTLKGVRLIVPSGILKSLTVLVSWPANGGSFVHDCTSVLLWRRNNPCWAPNHYLSHLY